MAKGKEKSTDNNKTLRESFDSIKMMSVKEQISKSKKAKRGPSNSSRVQGLQGLQGLDNTLGTQFIKDKTTYQTNQL